MERHYSASSVTTLTSKIRVNKNIKKFISKYIKYLLVITILLVMYILNTKAFIVILFFIICVLSMQHLRYFPWLGAPDMNLILTAYVSVNYGLPTGLLLGNASFFGLLLSGDIDSNIFYDLIFSYITALIASMFTMQYYVQLVIILSIMHAIGFIIYHKLLGTLEMMNLMWITTHLLWVVFFITKVCKMFGLC